MTERLELRPATADGSFDLVNPNKAVVARASIADSAASHAHVTRLDARAAHDWRQHANRLADELEVKLGREVDPGGADRSHRVPPAGWIDVLDTTEPEIRDLWAARRRERAGEGARPGDDGDVVRGPRADAADRRAGGPRPLAGATEGDLRATRAGKEQEFAEPSAMDQEYLESLVPPGKLHPSPLDSDGDAAPWVQAVNDGGPESLARCRNCVDCSLAGISTWFGHPEVAAARRADPAGIVRGEAVARAEQWLSAPVEWRGADGDAMKAIADRLEAAGPGAAAWIAATWSLQPDYEQTPQEVSGHAWFAVNDGGRVVWIDTQHGLASTEPLYEEDASSVWAIMVK